MYTRKITVALALVLVCLIVLLSASYAWLTMSIRPEVNGIETHIGANGSLEIALLSEETFIDPTLIKTQAGDSAAKQEASVSNLSWGNVVDLSGESYGLDHISMYPARLNVRAVDEDSGTVGSNMLLYAEYGLDGRISQFYDQTASGVYLDGSFRFNTESQSYGVRGIGSASGLTAAQSALMQARTAVPTYANAAKRLAESAWEEYGAAIMNVYYKRYHLGYSQSIEEHRQYTQKDRQNILGMLEMTLEAYDYLDAMMREYIMGYAATQMSDAEQFELFCDYVRMTPMLTLLIDYTGNLIPDQVQILMHNLDTTRTSLQYRIEQLKKLPDGDCCWSDIYECVFALITSGEYGAVYFNECSLDEDGVFDAISNDNILRVDTDPGALSWIATYAGTYSAFFEWDETVSVEVRVAKRSSYAQTVAEQFAESLEAEAENSEAAFGEIQDICGFAVDLAFRCNERANLLLQTEPETRVEGSVEAALLQGSGSSMKFTSEQLDSNQMLKLMDGIRIGFLNDQGEILAVAKLNTANYSESKDGVSAPLYLYEFTISADGVITTGERLKENSAIMALPKSTASIMTAVVWLDGDYVDNSFASISGSSVSGSLNLQFSTDAELVASSQSVDVD